VGIAWGRRGDPANHTPAPASPQGLHVERTRRASIHYFLEPIRTTIQGPVQGGAGLCAWYLARFSLN
jgi:hypothetical protein